VSVRFYDAHNHLQDARFDAAGAGVSRADIVAQAVQVGLARMVVNGACEEDWPAVRQLAEQFPQVLPSFGYHPWYLHERTPTWQQRLLEYLDATPSAVGEIGLDRWKPDLPYEGQEDAFAWQLRLAAERNLPASIHCLQAWGRLHDLLRANPRPARGFLLHSYGGSKEMVEPLAKLGAYFSFPGYFMHERKVRQRDTFRAVPIERLLIETDAPDQRLPDSDNRFPLTDIQGEPLNHPANVGAIYDFLARERGVPLDTFAAQLEDNFSRLFGSVR
jgi:TatD DNase family protein